MEKLSLKDKVAIITGSSSGLGETTAVLFAQRGCTVVLSGRNEERLDLVRQQCVDTGLSKDKVLIIPGDLREAEVRKRLVQKTVETYGKLNILVNNAADTGFGFFGKVTEADYDRVNNYIVKMHFFLTQEAIPSLIITKGNIINVSSLLSIVPQARGILYGMFKSAMDMMSRTIAIEYGPLGVRCNCINPGGTKTPIINRLFDAAGIPMDKRQEFVDAEMQRHGMKRFGHPYEVPETIAFLASDAAGFITAQTVFVDGGASFNYWPPGKLQ